MPTQVALQKEVVQIANISAEELFSQISNIAYQQAKRAIIEAQTPQKLYSKLEAMQLLNVGYKKINSLLAKGKLVQKDNLGITEESINQFMQSIKQ